ncbi:MAG: acetyl-CoA C-acyltransferase [Chloroflexota bacterium]|nr:MAG: acetyl-CoA C-acyltransferase [Chloroflexota bacterium]
MRQAVIVSGVRTAVGKAPRGKLRTTRPDDMAATVVREAFQRAGGLKPEDIDDVIIGCAMPEGESGLNMGRIAALRAGLPNAVTGMTVNRFCASGLQTIALAAQQIRAGWGDCIIAGGAESMSMVPMIGFHFAPNPYLAMEYPSVYLGMGLTAENVAEQYDVSRQAQDEFAYRSHRNALAAIEAGKFQNEVVPLDVNIFEMESSGTREEKYIFNVDEGPRRDTTLEALANLKPVFRNGGSVTAGNSSQTSDGAGAVVVMSDEKARALGMKPLVKMVSFAVGGVAPEIMGIGPVQAIPKALKLAGLELKEIDVIELNEAFAAQAVAVIRQLEMDEDKVNVNGGAIALGHPLGATGAKLTVQLIHEMKRRNLQYGMVTMCIGGGMGAAGIFENVE